MPPAETDPVEWLAELRRLAEHAGATAADLYRREAFDVRVKDDRSPVTTADLASQRILVEGLERLAPEIPCVSEETAARPYAERRTWRRLWLVDPLDGTRELVAGRGEFTVNVALVENGEPVLGVVHAPIVGSTYSGAVGHGAWRHDDGDDVSLRARGTGGALPVVAVSRSHRGELLSRLLEHLPEHRLVSLGSSLKLCLVAEGRADLYPRLTRTMEWDTAAAHAVLRAAGGRVLDPDGRPLRYNKEHLDNPCFFAVGETAVPWRAAWRQVADDAG